MNVKPALLAVLAITLLMMPEIALAAGDYPGQALLERISGILVGPLARSVGIIMIAVTCYTMYKGRVDWERAFCVIGAVVGVLAAATIYDMAAAGVS